MKLLRYGPPGGEKPGLLAPDGTIRSLGDHLPDVDGAALVSDALARLAALDPAGLPAVDPGVRLGSCVARPGKFLAIGLNYADHAAETGAAIPDEPIIFMKATSCLAGPNDDVIQPRGSTKLDWEVELAFVIGRTCRYVSEEEGAAAIAGYALCNDVSERAFQLERGGTWDKGKGCDSFGPLGPWLVTCDEIADPHALAMWCEVNGTRYQDGSTATMIFRPAYLVSYLSRFMTLEPGDVVTTGTPPGVGMGQKPPVFLTPGDTMRLGIQGLGEQRQRVVAAS